MASKRASESSSTSSTEFVRIGRVGRPHGTEGGFSVSEPTERIALLEPGREVWLGGALRAVVWRKGTPAQPVIKVERVDDRDSARALTGSEIHITRDAIGPLPPGEYLIDELVGMEVVDGERSLGRVSDVLVLPSVEALEVERRGADPLLVPLVRDAVRTIDADRSVIDVDSRFLEGGSDGD